MVDPKIQRALISVSDKTGLAELAQALDRAGVAIYSTGGTRKFLEEQGIEAREIARYTGFPEMMDGRLKTLHPKVFGGILCRHDREDDMQAIDQHGIKRFELVVVNLYPFEATIARPGVTDEEAIEQIDIGGPSLVRAASKNHAFVTIATSPSQYGELIGCIEERKATTLEIRRRLAGEAFAHTAAYDATIAGYFAKGRDELFPQQLSIPLRRSAELRYGENSHQQAAVYKISGSTGASLVTAEQLNGKELSYNNLLDLDSALAIVRMFSGPAATVIKHNNPCGAAVGGTLAEAARKALSAVCWDSIRRSMPRRPKCSPHPVCSSRRLLPRPSMQRP
jgi:phosphoribosylaminoimidazolecarboxamide formyltransferase / IMP cyclohydrolase